MLKILTVQLEKGLPGEVCKVASEQTAGLLEQWASFTNNSVETFLSCTKNDFALKDL